MTRINVGIYPCELCDQHLIAEYRELPRCFAPDKFKGPAPERFKLSHGHVLWCVAHQGSLYLRQLELIAELQRRGFDPQHTDPPAPQNDRYWTGQDWDDARHVVMLRIRDRVATMRAKPRWTGRQPPAWLHPALASRGLLPSLCRRV